MSRDTAAMLGKVDQTPRSDPGSDVGVRATALAVRCWVSVCFLSLSLSLPLWRFFKGRPRSEFHFVSQKTAS